MNIVTVAGRVGKEDAVVRKTQGGTSVTSFSVGADSMSRGEKKTLWYDCSVWGDRGEKVAQYLKRGTPVTISGDLGVREYVGRDGKPGFSLTVNVDKLALQGGAKGGSDTRSGGGSTQQGNDLDDEIPF